jgi:2-polyprenyl-6-methoxyphenol hydroxylase-like FAD-dependent oxidoreductase
MNRTNRPSVDVPVTVVGAGPAGLMAAITLARQGVECLVLDRRSDRSALPRATVVSLRNMELMRAWGLDAAVRSGGDDVDILMFECETLAAADRGTAIDVGYPTARQSEVISPSAPACVPQDHLEAVLFEHLTALPAATIRTGAAVAEVDVTSAGPRLHLADGSTVRSRYVVAADGAHSAVRSSLGIEMRGDDRLHDGVHVQFRAPLWDVVGPHRFGLYVTTGTDPVCVVLPAGSDRWVIGFPWDPANERLEDYTDDRLAALIGSAAGTKGLPVRIERVGSFSFAALVADRFREGDVFLVGDAAHRVTPRGGTGMNTAMADGFDLGWRLAWVLQGWAAPAVLDGYERDRRPLAEHNLLRSADENGSRRAPLVETNVDRGGRIAHHWLGPSGDRSTLDLVGPGLTVLVGPDGGAWTRAAGMMGTSPPIDVHQLDAVAARVLAITGDGALLVRPDGVAVAAWPDAAHAAARLREAVTAVSARSAEQQDAA